MLLNEIRDRKGATHSRKRVGRGIGSGTGKTAGRGHKGQKSRSGVSLLGFEGGQMPIYRRLPKRGFNNIFKLRYAIVNTGRIQAFIDSGKLDSSKPITAETLKASGLVNRALDGIRLLAKGDLKAKITIEVTGFSAKAKKMVEAKGGSVTIVEKIVAAPKAKADEKPKTPAKKATAPTKKAATPKKAAAPKKAVAPKKATTAKKTTSTAAKKKTPTKK